MSNNPNIYATVVFDLHSKVREFIDQLNRDGQIDVDDSGYPYLIGSDRNGTNIVTRISRNNRLENFVLNPRKKSAPLCSWQMDDGFARPQQKRKTVMQPQAEDKSGPQRERRKVSEAVVKNIVKSIMED